MMPAAPHVASYYAATANPSPEHRELEGEVGADVCVIGAGFAGLSAALHLAERGYDVVVLEANRVGWGASGRNGGQAGTGFATGMDKIPKWVGTEDARRLFDMCEEAKAIIEERVKKHRIECGLKKGVLAAALKKRQMDTLAEASERYASLYGYDQTRLVDAGEMSEMLGTKIYCGGMVDAGAGHLHPLNYCLGLADGALAAGVRIFEGSRVGRLETGPTVAAFTDQGVVRAKLLVVCGNAYLGGLVPAIQGKIMPVGTYMAASEPLGEARARELIRDDVAVYDCNFVLNYYRLSEDHRMLFGGRVSHSTIEPPNLSLAMRRRMARVYPQLRDVKIDYVWGGLMAITVERTPHFGRLADNVYFVHGYSGHGVALTGLAGKLIAEAVAGDAERFDIFARLPHTTFPGGPLLRVPALVLAMLYYRIRDLL